MDYCCEIWGNRLQTQTNRIIKLQKRAARIIINCNMHTTSRDLSCRLKWISFNERVHYFRCDFIYKCSHSLSAGYFDNFFKELIEVHKIITKQSVRRDLAIPKCHTEYRRHSVCYDGPFLQKIPLIP